MDNVRKDSQYGPKAPKGEDSFDVGYLEYGLGAPVHDSDKDQHPNKANTKLTGQHATSPQTGMTISPHVAQDWVRASMNDLPKNGTPGTPDAVLASLGGIRHPTHRRTGSRGSQLPVDVKLWTMNFSDMTVERQIGEGSFGRVYVAKWNETMVAVKVLIGMGTIEEDGEEEDAGPGTGTTPPNDPVLDSLAKESTMMAALRHPNIVGFLGVCLSPPCIVTEYCARGSLTDVLRGGKYFSAKASLLDWPRRLNMALDAAKGMLYLHAHNPPIIHRDLKSPNLLVDRYWRVKVSDFNLSKLLEEGSVMSSMAATNPRWLAPEILTGNDATFSSDVYSFAIVMWELLTWELPWGSTNPWQIVSMVTEGRRLEIPPRAALPGPDTSAFDGLDSYVGLICRCWAQDPENRPSFQEIIAELRYLLSTALAKRGPSSAFGQLTSTQSSVKSHQPNAGTISGPTFSTPASPTSNVSSGTLAVVLADEPGGQGIGGPLSTKINAPQHVIRDYSSTTAQAASVSMDVDGCVIHPDLGISPP